MNPRAARVGPTVKGKSDGKGKVRSGTHKEVNDLRSKEPGPGRRFRAEQAGCGTLSRS
jgi:hypothetical protein